MSVVDQEQLATQRESFASVFPLPLTILESFMFMDDRPDYSMMADLELQFQGCIDRAAFDSALAFAIGRNPLFTCLVERAHDGSLCWIPTDRVPSIDWAPLGTELDERYGEMVDLTKDIGLRIWVRYGFERSTVLLHFHHSCSDAMGGFGFIEDLFVGYILACAGSEPVSPRPLEPERLLTRGEIGLAGRSVLRRISDSFAGSREGARFFLQAPLSLMHRRGRSAADAPPVRPGFIATTCSERVSSGLRLAASRGGATANDVLLRDLFLVLRQWNVAEGFETRRRRLRILMPQNLREREDYTMPAANMLSFAFVTRRSDCCDTPAELLQSIREETEAVRRGKLSLYFTGGLAGLHSAGLLSRVLQSRLCFATAVLTNMSDPTRRFVARFRRTSEGLLVGNLIFVDVVGVPPLRPRTHVAIAVTNRDQKFSFRCKWDPHHFSVADAQRLLDAYTVQLEATAEEALAEVGAE